MMAPVPSASSTTGSRARLRTLAAIGLDDQPRFNADEVDDVGWNGELAAELPAELASPQITPQEPLGVRHVQT